MGKNNPENIGSHVRSEGVHIHAESRILSATGPRSVESFTANLNGRRGAKREKTIEAGGGALRLSAARNGQVDFGDAIGKELQSLYDDVVAQPVPDRFLNLLNMLEKNMLTSGGGK